MSNADKQGFITDFDWRLYPQAEKILYREVNNFLKSNTAAKNLALRMEKETATRFFDWVDHITIPENRITLKIFERSGFKAMKTGTPDGTIAYKHSGAAFPSVLFSSGKKMEIALKPENIEDFAAKSRIDGVKFGSYRKAAISDGLIAVERRGYAGFVVRNDKDITEYTQSLNLFGKRERKFATDAQGMDATEKLVEKSIKKLSRPRMADAFFRAERAYWEARNSIGRFQRKRQDKLGLGWGNHDHHTYRSSRENFAQLIRIFEKMGYLCRERFYAGPAAGWGAQILEHPDCDIVLFADVDITAEEKEHDFAHEPLGPEKKMGTVGLWIGLHGESMLQAGLHHLEARFDFDLLGNQLAKNKLGMMKPFSYFDFLKQAFTAGEIWKVDKNRLDTLLAGGFIDKSQYNSFRKEGALGSHMENLMRTQGFKGFNQNSVTAIIKATDPRKYIHHHEAA